MVSLKRFIINMNGKNRHPSFTNHHAGTVLVSRSSCYTKEGETRPKCTLALMFIHIVIVMDPGIRTTSKLAC